VSRPIVDWHSHVWRPEHLSREWREGLDAHYPHTPSACGDYDDHAQAMAEAGVNACVVIALWSEHLGVRIPNEYIAEYVERWNGHAIGVASVDPNRRSARDEVRYAARELGLQGLKLSPPYQSFHPHSDEAWAVYRAAADEGLFLMFHQGAVTLRRGVLEYAQPVLLDRVARELPDTRIIVAHVGQPWYVEVMPMLRKHPHMYADLSARCSRPWQLRNILLSAIDYGLTDKLLWGSDFPTFMPKAHSEQLLGVNEALDGAAPLIPRSHLESILFDRPLSYLGLNARTE
jgi:predicted TIM-barrel fold metal-dependent hydrolase